MLFLYVRSYNMKKNITYIGTTHLVPCSGWAELQYMTKQVGDHFCSWVYFIKGHSPRPTGLLLPIVIA